MDIHTNPSEATWTRNLVERSAKPVSELVSELTRPLARASVGPLSSGNQLSSLRLSCSKADRRGVAAGLRSGCVQRALPEVGFGRAHSVGVGRRFYGRTTRVCRVTDVEGQVDGPAVALGPRPRGIPACPTSTLTFSQIHFSPSCDGRRKPDGRSSKKTGTGPRGAPDSRSSLAARKPSCRTNELR